MASPRTERSRSRRTTPDPSKRTPAKQPEPIAPYYAIGLSTVVYGTSKRDHIARNLETTVKLAGAVFTAKQLASGVIDSNKCETTPPLSVVRK